MKTLKHIVLLSLLTLLLSPFSLAQNFDANRMSRDIRIMENILAEVFKTTLTTNESRLGSSWALATTRINQNNIKGTYVPDYGIIFMIPNPSENHIRIVRKGDEDAKIVFEHILKENGAQRELSEESITNRITQFLKDYASTIGQLAKDERIMVVYGEKSSNTPQLRVLNLINGENEELPKEDPIPIITISVKKSDLDDLRDSKINADTFESRLTVSKSDGESSLDLKVMGNILQTALEEGDGEEFHLINRNSLSYLRIDGFGALYTLNLHAGHGLPKAHFTSYRLDETERANKATEVFEKERENFKNALKNEYVDLVKRVKEYMVDYGRTLNSLNNDEIFMISANIMSNEEEVPKRVNFQIKKSTLQQLDRGQISRENAISAVTISEY